MEISAHKGLTIEEVVNTACMNETVSLSGECESVIEKSNDILNRIIDSKEPVYGINTGFGIFSDKRIPIDDSKKLSRNLIISHAVGIGPELEPEIVRAAMLVRANTLAKGFSGVRLILVKTILEMINKEVSPVIPSQGSLGSSGDLCPLSHFALVLTKDLQDLEQESGQAYVKGELLSGKKAMEKANIERVELGPKEGLALNNGATFSAAIAALSVAEADYLLHIAELSTAMSMEALAGRSDAFDDRIHVSRNQAGQIETAKNIASLFKNSSLVDSTEKIQDAYSLRCSPQIQGAVRDTVKFVRTIIEREINAATDNPLIFEPDKAISGGNFHGEPVGLVMDYLSIALSELGAISERRIFRMTDGKLNNGLPPMLVDSNEGAGLNSGLMMPQYTAASLVLENQTYATPDSVHSLPTSAEQEDHNANAMTAARHAYKIVSNVRHILSIEIYTAVRAIDLRMRVQQGKLGLGTEKAYRIIRNYIPYQAGDALWGPEIQIVYEMLKNHEL